MPAPVRWNFLNPILDVSDVRRSIAYYRDVLGLTPIWIWEERIGGVSDGSIELYLSRADRPSPSRIAVFVEDADAAYEKYRTAGAEIVDEIETAPWGLRGFTVRDPDGNLIGVSHEVHSPLGRPEYEDLTTHRVDSGRARGSSANEPIADPRCSFCGKHRQEVESVVAGAGSSGPVVICNECVELCVEIFAEESGRRA